MLFCTQVELSVNSDQFDCSTHFDAAGLQLCVQAASSLQRVGYVSELGDWQDGDQDRQGRD